MLVKCLPEVGDDLIECLPVSQPRMHDNEVDTDADLVRCLLASQHPQWADLPIEAVAFDGWDNRTFRLGEDMAVPDVTIQRGG